MNENRVKILFEDMAYHTDYSLLEEGKNDDELKEIAIKKGLVVPSRDLAIFKGRYAMVDKENKNKCTLPKKEVKKALKTLNGKAVDKDHLRGSVVGHWLEAELDGDEILTYAVFFKSNFPDDYDEFKKKMSTGKMKISFEAWGEREFKENGSYDLRNIEFAGGALLFETNPAFPEAEVLEMSNKVLEFAKVLDEKEVESDGGSSNIEDAGVEVTENYIRIRQKEPSTFEQDSFRTITISKSKGIKAVIGKLKGETSTTVQSFLFDKDKWTTAEAKKWISEHKGNVVEEEAETMEEAKLSFNWDTQTIARMMYEGKCPGCDTQGWFDVNNIDFDNGKLDVTCGSCGAKSKMDLIPQMTLVKKGKKIEKSTQDTTKIDSKNSEEKGGEKVMEEILKKYGKGSVEEVVSFLEKEIEIVKASLSTKDTELATVKSELDTVKASAKEVKDALDAKIAAEKATIVTARRTELGDSVKDMSDTDLLDDTKYELAKTKKELATLKAEKPAQGGLEAGAEIKEDNPVMIKQKSIHAKAFPQTDSQ